MKKTLLVTLFSSLVFADGELGQKFKNIIDALIDILNSGPVLSIVTLVIIICGIMLIFKMFEKAKWLFISTIIGTIIIYSGTVIAKAIIGAVA